MGSNICVNMDILHGWWVPLVLLLADSLWDDWNLTLIWGLDLINIMTVKDIWVWIWFKLIWIIRVIELRYIHCRFRLLQHIKPTT